MSVVDLKGKPMEADQHTVDAHDIAMTLIETERGFHGLRIIAEIKPDLLRNVRPEDGHSVSTYLRKIRMHMEVIERAARGERA